MSRRSSNDGAGCGCLTLIIIAVVTSCISDHPGIVLIVFGSIAIIIGICFGVNHFRKRKSEKSGYSHPEKSNNSAEDNVNRYEDGKNAVDNNNWKDTKSGITKNSFVNKKEDNEFKGKMVNSKEFDQRVCALLERINKLIQKYQLSEQNKNDDNQFKGEKSKKLKNLKPIEIVGSILLALGACSLLVAIILLCYQQYVFFAIFLAGASLLCVIGLCSFLDLKNSRQGLRGEIGLEVYYNKGINVKDRLFFLIKFIDKLKKTVSPIEIREYKADAVEDEIFFLESLLEWLKKIVSKQTQLAQQFYKGNGIVQSLFTIENSFDYSFKLLNFYLYLNQHFIALELNDWWKDSKKRISINEEKVEDVVDFQNMGIKYNSLVFQLCDDNKKEFTQETAKVYSENENQEETFVYTEDEMIAKLGFYANDITNKKINEKIKNINNNLIDLFSIRKNKITYDNKIAGITRNYIPLCLKNLRKYYEIENKKKKTIDDKELKKEIEIIVGKTDDVIREALESVELSEKLDIETDVELINTLMAKDGYDSKKRRK